MFRLRTTRRILHQNLVLLYSVIRRFTSVDVVHPSGNIQARGSEPCTKQGLQRTTMSEQTRDLENLDLTSMVKQSPGTMIPGSSFTAAEYSSLKDEMMKPDEILR